jgi:hypothetical protein
MGAPNRMMGTPTVPPPMKVPKGGKTVNST